MSRLEKLDPKQLSKLKFIGDFKSFLLKHGVVGLAVGIVIGGAVSKLVKAIVDDLIMPLVGFLIPEGDWRLFKLTLGPFKFGIGDFAGNFIDFIIISLVVFLIVKRIISEAPPSPTKQCPECLENISPAAKKCKFCGSTV